MYQKVSTDMNFAQREEEVIKFWRDEDIFKKTVKLREGAPAFTFFDGPPTANGKPHIGHVETRAIKDIIPRYRTMKGYDVLRKAGWDTHGLPGGAGSGEDARPGTASRRSRNTASSRSSRSARNPSGSIRPSGSR